MTIAADIIKDALLRLGVYAPGQMMSSADSRQAFETFNDMLDYFSTQSLACYANLQQSFVLTPGISQYTIGPGGTVPGMVRPMQILNNPGGIRCIDEMGTVYPMDVIDQFAWGTISSGTQPNSQVITSNVPEVLFYDPQFPDGVINLWPTPTDSYTLYFTSRLALADAATMNSAITLPPGYNLMLKANLAARLLPYFGGQVSAQDKAALIGEARETLAQIKRINTVVPLPVFDKTLVKKSMSTPYNIFTDGR